MNGMEWPVAFLLSGEMCVGYFRTHAPRGFWPLANGGELAVFYAFFYLGMAFSQTVAGFLRDITGDASMPLLFAASLMVVTVAAVAAFWQIEDRPTAGVD